MCTSRARFLNIWNSEALLKRYSERVDRTNGRLVDVTKDGKVNAFARPGRPESSTRTLLTDDQMKLVTQEVERRVRRDKLTALKPSKRAKELFKEQIRILFKKKPPCSDEFYRRRAELGRIVSMLKRNNNKSRSTHSRNKKEKRRRVAARRLELKRKL